jgi:hypothetical protein
MPSQANLQWPFIGHSLVERSVVLSQQDGDILRSVQLRIRSQPGFFLLGDVTSGTVQAGMVANVWLDGGAYTPAPIVAVEFVDFSDGKSLTALHVHCASRDDESLLEELIPDGETIEIVAPTGNASPV